MAIGFAPNMTMPFYSFKVNPRGMEACKVRTNI
jgi:hypothetical protein